MRLVDTKDAVGHMLCHDLTQIIRGVTKQARFRKGHIIKEEDIPVLLSMGKEHLYIWENNADMLHENEAAAILRDLCQNTDMRATEPVEGKIELIAEVNGLFQVDLERLHAVNALGEMMIATRSSGFPVKKDDVLAGTRVIPLLIEKEKMEHAKETAGDEPLLFLHPLQQKKYGLITTGNEIYEGRIVDASAPVMQAKLSEYGCEMHAHAVLPDDHARITRTILQMVEDGAEMVFCTGGMSVDPDDRTPLAIKNTGAEIVTYGAPVLPGAMFLLAYTDTGVPICGLPGCVMYAKRTVFDLILPRLLADVRISPAMLADLGHGGLCLNCDICHFPNCMFGKGAW